MWELSFQFFFHLCRRDHYLAEPCPAELRNSYFSHRCKFQVFPTDGTDLPNTGTIIFLLQAIMISHSVKEICTTVSVYPTYSVSKTSFHFSLIIHFYTTHRIYSFIPASLVKVDIFWNGLKKQQSRLSNHLAYKIALYF